ncbi:hypothetical protein EZV73_04260 [Acidaminobacter sp. JC074]|uniref:hypothetical protein n=1 Tax=Acidaminobacter sp. JC074 TaxID=2530199 RepID=UPI001F0CEE1F|nr:hypothetical protein [Acidaminobacter sp. JC074]MCH4886766.1 hypothetical protein [Acidaminobacter sp. JC074]
MRSRMKFMVIILIIWLLVFSIDTVLVFAFNAKPVFTIEDSSAQKDGCGNYYGLGYHYDIEGHFDDCDCILQGVVEADMYIFGQPVHHMIRVFEP